MKKSVLLFLIFSSLLSFSQTAEELLLEFKIEEREEYHFDNYVDEIETFEEDPETLEFSHAIAYMILEFSIDAEKEVVSKNNLYSVPLTLIRHSEDGSIIEFEGFYAAFAKSNNKVEFVNLSPPTTHYFSKNKEGLFVLHRLQYSYVNHLPNQYHQQLTTTYTNQEIETHYSNLLNEYMSLMDSNYLYLDGQEFTDTLVLEFFVENSFERKFNHEDKIIYQHVKAYNNLKNLQYWGNLFEMTDDFSLNAQLREKQEKLVAQDFILVFKYDNSFPKPIFELLKIIPPNGLEWKPITETKYLLKMNVEEK